MARVEETSKRKNGEDRSSHKPKKKLRTITAAKKKKTTEGEDTIKVKLHLAEIPGLWTVRAGLKVVTPETEKSVEEIEAEAKEIISQVG